jgi:hypothetical protein
MRVAAIIFNLIQMAIVLAIFVLQGMSFTGWTILGLFILLIIACFNLLVLLFHSFSDQQLIGGEKPAIVKRQDLRVVYRGNAKPLLKIGGRSFPVLDIAESGLRIRIDRNESIKKRFKGCLKLMCGEAFNIRAVVVRREGDDAAMQFKYPLSYALLLKEKQAAASAGA